MRLLLVTLTLIAVVSGWQTKYCCYPAQFEGNQGVLSGSVDDEGHAAVTTGNIAASFDISGQRIYMDDFLTVGNQTKHYIILQLYKLRFMYIVEGTRCTKVPLTTSFPTSSFCVPDNATLENTYVMGGQQNITVWEYHFMAGNQDFYTGVTDHCMLVTIKTYGEINGEKSMFLMGFQGATLGIRDPTIFNIPPACQHARLATVPKVLRKKLSLFRI